MATGPADAPGAPRAGIRPGLRLSSLGLYLRWLRESRGVSQEKAARNVPMSTVHLGAIENGKRVPSRHTLNSLMDGYQTDAAQRRHAHELLAPPTPLVPTRELRTRISSTPGLVDRLHDLEAVGLIAAYLDPTWGVLEANTGFRRAFPGLADANWVQWFFGPVARHIFTDWEHEASLLVRLLKADLAPYRSALTVRGLLKELERDDDFYRLWSTENTPAYGRDDSDVMHLRERDSGTPFSLSVQTSRLDTHSYVRHFLGIRKPSHGNAG